MSTRFADARRVAMKRALGQSGESGENGARAMPASSRPRKRAAPDTRRATCASRALEARSLKHSGCLQLISSALRNDAAKTWRWERLYREYRRSMTQRKRISDVLQGGYTPLTCLYPPVTRCAPKRRSGYHNATKQLSDTLNVVTSSKEIWMLRLAKRHRWSSWL